MPANHSQIYNSGIKIYKNFPDHRRWPKSKERDRNIQKESYRERTIVQENLF